VSILDFYALLGIPHNAAQIEITRAYRRRARQCHPDMVDPMRRDWAETEMKRLNLAYSVLSNPQKRAAYDRQRMWEADPVLRQVQYEQDAYVRRQATKQSWKRIQSTITLVIDVVSIVYVLLVGFLILFVWRGYYASLRTEVEHPNEVLMLFIWFFAIIRLLLRSIPFPRLRRPIRWF
jgi:curved DNA-binding protein CbpA